MRLAPPYPDLRLLAARDLHCVSLLRVHFQSAPGDCPVQGHLTRPLGRLASWNVTYRWRGKRGSDPRSRKSRAPALLHPWRIASFGTEEGLHSQDCPRSGAAAESEWWRYRPSSGDVAGTPEVHPSPGGQSVKRCDRQGLRCFWQAQIAESGTPRHLAAEDCILGLLGMDILATGDSGPGVPVVRGSTDWPRGGARP
jgi:hypothetical protein